MLNLHNWKLKLHFLSAETAQLGAETLLVDAENYVFFVLKYLAR